MKPFLLTRAQLSRMRHTRCHWQTKVGSGSRWSPIVCPQSHSWKNMRSQPFGNFPSLWNGPPQDLDRLRRRVRRLESDLGYTNMAFVELSAIAQPDLPAGYGDVACKPREQISPPPVHHHLHSNDKNNGSTVSVGQQRKRSRAKACPTLEPITRRSPTGRKRRCDLEADGRTLNQSRSQPLATCSMPAQQARRSGSIHDAEASKVVTVDTQALFQQVDAPSNVTSSRFTQRSEHSSLSAQGVVPNGVELLLVKPSPLNLCAYLPDRKFFPALGYVVGEMVDKLVDDGVVSVAKAKGIRMLLAAENNDIRRLLRVYEEGSNTDGAIRDFLHALDGLLDRHGITGEFRTDHSESSQETSPVDPLAPIDNVEEIARLGSQHGVHSSPSQLEHTIEGGLETRVGPSLEAGRRSGRKECGDKLGLPVGNNFRRTFKSERVGCLADSLRKLMSFQNSTKGSQALPKLKQGLDRSNAEVRPKALLVGSGTFNPVHKLHLRRFYLARHFLEEHVGYSWLTVDPWEITRRRIMDYMSVLEHVRDVLHDTFPGLLANITILYLCPASQVLKLNPTLLRVGGFGIITVCRPLERERLIQQLSPPFARIVHVVEDLAILSAELEKTSSTAVRACLKEGKLVDGMVGRAVAHYIKDHRLADKISGKQRWSNEDKAFKFEREDKDDRPYHSIPPQYVRRPSQMPLQH